MLAARQYSNSSASLNPFNSIPQAQPTATQPLVPAQSLTGTLKPAESTPVVVPLPSSIYDGITPSQASELSSLFAGYRPSSTRTITLGLASTTAKSVSGVFTGTFGSPSSMASGSRFGESVRHTSTVISFVPGPSKTITVSSRQSDVARASAQPSSTKSIRSITTSTSLTTVFPSSSTTSSRSSSSTSSVPTSSSAITSVPAARATSTSPDMSSQHKASLSTAAIAGITFASAASVAILALLLFFCLKRRRTHKPPSIYPEEAYLYDPPITPPSGMPPSLHSAQPWMSGNTAYHPTTQLPSGIPQSPPTMPQSPPMRAITPEGYERVGLLGIPEEEQDMGMMGAWPSLRGRNSGSYRPLGTGRGYRLPPVHEELQESIYNGLPPQHQNLQESIDNDPRNPFRD